MIVGCIGDQVLGIDKDTILVWAVIFDGLSLCTLYYFFNKLEILNKEFLDTYDNYVIDMKDFAIQCTDVLLDEETQDSRLIKMKIWLHFTDTLEFARKANGLEFSHEVVDVTLSITT